MKSQPARISYKARTTTLRTRVEHLMTLNGGAATDPPIGRVVVDNVVL
jgi:hypothetical protein